MKILILNKPNVTDFAKERNSLLTKYKNEDWVLFLDSDESIIGDLYPDPYTNKFESYYLKRKNYFLKQYVGTDKIIRLVKVGTGRFERAVHEKWVPLRKNLTKVAKSPILIHHTADNLSDYLNKINNYSNLHAVENKKENKKSSIFKIIFYPIGKFIFTLIKSRNIVFSIMQSLHSYLSWTKLYLH